MADTQANVRVVQGTNEPSPPPQTPSAALRTLSTPELLSTILSHLDPEPLLCATAVTHLWRATIDTTPSLQQNLFLRADPNPLFWACPTIAAVRLNPLLFAEEPLLHARVAAAGYAVVRPGLLKLGDNHGSGTGRSYDGMFLTQPPTCEAMLLISLEREGWESVVECNEIVEPEGLRFRMLVERVRKDMQEARATGLRFCSVTVRDAACRYPREETGRGPAVKFVMALF